MSKLEYLIQNFKKILLKIGSLKKSKFSIFNVSTNNIIIIKATKVGINIILGSVWQFLLNIYFIFLKLFLFLAKNYNKFWIFWQ